MSIFNIPQEVLFELMDGDIADIAAEAEAERRAAATSSSRLILREADRRAAITKPVTCPDCGEENLYWTKDAEGEDCLAYMYGALRSRLHACE